MPTPTNTCTGCIALSDLVLLMLASCVGSYQGHAWQWYRNYLMLVVMECHTCVPAHLIYLTSSFPFFFLCQHLNPGPLAYEWGFKFYCWATFLAPTPVLMLLTRNDLWGWRSAELGQWLKRAGVLGLPVRTPGLMLGTAWSFSTPGTSS